MARLGWESLRPVQEISGEALLDGCNAVVLAPTAGGKTEASMFPTLSMLLEHPPDGVGALYIAPIKALLNNQAERLGLYTEMVGLDRMVWHGDVSTSRRKAFLKDPTELLMTTPESLEVMLISGRAHKLFGDLRIVVIDEVHALAGSDRGAHLMSVLERISQISRHDLQRVGLSATVGNPGEIGAWLTGTSARPVRVIDPPKPPSPREILIVHRPELALVAHDAARIARGKKSLFFCQSRSATEAVAEQMRRFGTTVFVHHSAVSKEERELAEERFHHGSDACIVATSTLELGIDVGDLDRVLQSEAPDTVSSFMQRMGRTGRRAGQSANTTFFCEAPESVLQAIALVELAKSGWVESVYVDSRCWPVLVHQLLAMALERDGVPATDAWEHLSEVPDFKGIHRGEFNRLIAWMLRDGSLIETSGRLVIGPKTERKFGRRNFMELYAVFSSPTTYTVQKSDGQPLGTLSQGFVDRLVDGASCFLLAGRAWVVLQVRHDDRRIIVATAPRGKQPTWGGYLPQFLGMEVCQAVRDVLDSNDDYPYLHDTARSVLATRRESFEGVLGTLGGFEEDPDEIRWWTFAGGRINSTLRYALEAIDADWRVIPDNFLLKIRGPDLAMTRVREAIRSLQDLEFWEDDRLWGEVASELPNYRLSKFQPLMPPWVEREVIATHLLDIEGAWRWLTRSDSGGRALTEGVGPILARVLSMDATPDEPDEVPSITPSMPVRWVRSTEELAEVCELLASAERVALDVQTTLRERTLCLVQLAGAGFIALIDALEISDLSPLAGLLENSEVQKVIHNASFERSVLGKHGMTIENVVDTLKLSREIRGKVEGGHSLKAVCARELGIEVDKAEQVSDWTRRPLTRRQEAYAAMDVELLIRLVDAFQR